MDMSLVSEVITVIDFLAYFGQNLVAMTSGERHEGKAGMVLFAGKTV